MAPQRVELLAGLLLASLAPSAVSAQDVALERETTRWRFSYEQVDLPGEEDLGLVGLHYDLLGVLDPYPPLYVGLGGFAGVAGEKDGFFLLGGTAGSVWRVAPGLLVDAGVFAGAGGDAGGPATDGWAFRPFFAVERIFGLFGLRAEVAYFDMDEFEPDWNFALGLTLPSELLVGRESGRPGRIPPQAVLRRRVRVTPRFLGLDPDTGSMLRTGSAQTADVSMVGLGADYFLTQHVFVPVEAYGATGGGVDGFAMAGAGLGASIPIPGTPVSLEAKATLVTGGGGAVETGSGLGWQGLAGVRAALTRNLALEVMGGRTSFSDGGFDADSISVGLSWSGSPVELSLTYPRGNLERDGLSSDTVALETTRVVVSSRIYSPPSDALSKKGQQHDTISMLGFGVEELVHENVALTARVFAAFDGGVGGYSEGLLGARFEFRPVEWRNARLGVGIEGGAAGGGNVDVGSGLLFHTSAGLAIDLTERTFVSLEWGKAEADSGAFEAEAVTLGLGWNLGRPVLRD